MNRNRETIERQTIEEVVETIRGGAFVNEIHELREIYPLIHATKTEDGRLEKNFAYKMTLPRLCFATEIEKRRGKPQQQRYTGLIVLEANNLADYDEAIALRDKAARLPQTLMAFLGASGRSVKIVCRGELYPDAANAHRNEEGPLPLPTDEEEIRRFHLSLYKTARKAYNAQLDITLDALKPLIERTVYTSADPDIRYRPQAVPFYIDSNDEQPEPLPQAADNPEIHYKLMPGRTLK